MSFFDNQKSSKKKISPYVQIMMLGARRVGKTSLIASMTDSSKHVTAGTNLVLSKIGGKAIDDSLNVMKSCFKRQHFVNAAVEKGILDSASTRGFDRIDFKMTIANKKQSIPHIIRFVDCEGEWFNNRANEGNIGEEIEKSDVFMIAIDAVLLMEENAQYNGQNAVTSVTEFLINYVSPEELHNDKKLVLFVPVKCEKYMNQHERKGTLYYGKRMDMLDEKIRDEYAQLFDYLSKPNNCKRFTVAILPVITLGGVEFDEFVKNDGSHEILTDDIRYRYCEPNAFAPRFCEKPLVYSLLYVQKKITNHYYEKNFQVKNQNKRKLISILQEWFRDMINFEKDVDFIREIDHILDRLNNSNYPGYKMVQDPDQIEMRKSL